MRRSREFWVAAVAECERGELTQDEFAARRGVAVTTLRSWIYKLRRERKASVSLVPVRVIASTAPKARLPEAAIAELEIELPSGTRLRFSSSVAVEYVAALAQRLG
jgi:transposase-like protein